MRTLAVALCIFSVANFNVYAQDGAQREIEKLRSEVDRLGKENQLLRDENARLTLKVTDLNKVTSELLQRRGEFDDPDLLSLDLKNFAFYGGIIQRTPANEERKLRGRGAITMVGKNTFKLSYELTNDKHEIWEFHFEKEKRNKYRLTEFRRIINEAAIETSTDPPLELVSGSCEIEGQYLYFVMEELESPDKQWKSYGSLHCAPVPDEAKRKVPVELPK